MPNSAAATIIPLGRRADGTQRAAATGVGARPNALFVTPESGDVLQAGGLGEVSATLPRALRPACDAWVLVPACRRAKIRGIRPDQIRATL